MNKGEDRRKLGHNIGGIPDFPGWAPPRCSTCNGLGHYARAVLALVLIFPNKSYLLRDANLRRSGTGCWRWRWCWVFASYHSRKVVYPCQDEKMSRRRRCIRRWRHRASVHKTVATTQRGSPCGFCVGCLWWQETGHGGSRRRSCI